jgi:hypothetical protein
MKGIMDECLLFLDDNVAPARPECAILKVEGRGERWRGSEAPCKTLGRIAAQEDLLLLATKSCLADRKLLY